MNYDEEFINIFNEFYPFERYIIKNPKKINELFDDAILTEIFIPSTELSFKDFKRQYMSSIYLKLQCKGIEFRLAYFDFDDPIRETIRYIVENEFGSFAWQSLYIDYENDDDYEDLINILKEQKELITEKYGDCQIKKSWINDDRIVRLLNGEDDG